MGCVKSKDVVQCKPDKDMDSKEKAGITKPQISDA